MAYKTVLVHVGKDRQASERIEIAAKIAIAEDAHLIGAAPTGVSRYIYQSGMAFPGGGMAPHLETHLEQLRDHAQQCLKSFSAAAQNAGVASYETREVDDEAGGGISLAARYSDLVVIGQTDRDEPSPTTLPDFPEFVVMNAARPVLVVPHSGRYPTVGKRALVAWDASASATRAVTSAIPLLRRADNVDVVVFNPDAQGDEHGEQPGADIGLYLARHDIKINIIRQNTDIDVGNALLSMAADQNSDLLVMGGYGHTRFREILLGGVTRTVLESMTLPVLMTH